MRYYKKLYVGNNIDESVIDGLKKGKPSFNVYVVCVCGNPNSLFEILSTKELFKEHNQKKDYAVVAVMYGKQAAEVAVMAMVENWLDKHEDLQEIQNYYNNNSL
jgi:hypothetical protein